MLQTEFRLDHFHEYEKCMRQVQKLPIEAPHFWANLLGALINATVATMPDSVANSLITESLQKVREHIREKLKGEAP